MRLKLHIEIHKVEGDILVVYILWEEGVQVCKGQVQVYMQGVGVHIEGVLPHRHHEMHVRPHGGRCHGGLHDEGVLRQPRLLVLRQPNTEKIHKKQFKIHFLIEIMTNELLTIRCNKIE
jgi:hypothetical protein